MQPLTMLEKVDYLVIGHLTQDLTPEGPRLGGTASYSALTAQALGMRVGVVTSWAAEIPITSLHMPTISNYFCEHSTTFENIQTPEGRIQYVHSIAPKLDYYMIPEIWRNAAIVHLGPVAQEVEPGLARQFPTSFLGVTPQGWMRSWDSNGLVSHTEWPEANFVLQRANAAVISVEDVDLNEKIIEEMAGSSRVLAVTEAHLGARVYWNGDVRSFRPPKIIEIDPVGAGDVFAAAFFTRFFSTNDPWEAGRFATQLASISVTRSSFAGIPTFEEIKKVSIEVY
jgi:hypothetical protein